MSSSWAGSPKTRRVVPRVERSRREDNVEDTHDEKPGPQPATIIAVTPAIADRSEGFPNRAAPPQRRTKCRLSRFLFLFFFLFFFSFSFFFVLSSFVFFTVLNFLKKNFTCFFSFFHVFSIFNFFH